MLFGLLCIAVGIAALADRAVRFRAESQTTPRTFDETARTFEHVAALAAGVGFLVAGVLAVLGVVDFGLL